MILFKKICDMCKTIKTVKSLKTTEEFFDILEELKKNPKVTITNMSEEITPPTLSKSGLKTDCGIELNAKTAARFIPYGTMLLRVKAISKKANKYTFRSFHPRF